ncbi:MAG: ATP-binding cassette domain-containing protein [Alphaproteobacteria bacterium]
MTIVLEAQAISVRRGKRAAVDNVSLTVEAGERLIILGPNGAGKSLLLQCLHGLIDVETGAISCDAGVESARAFLFQRPELLRRSVRANLDFVLRHNGVKGRRGKVKELLASHGLESFARRRADRLSGGEAQRVALARAAALDPQLLLLDEPATALDPTATAKVEQMITALNAAGTTIIMTTHDLMQARRLATRIAFMVDGKILESGSADNFFAGPQTQAARNFLNGAFELDGSRQ